MLMRWWEMVVVQAVLLLLLLLLMMLLLLLLLLMMMLLLLLLPLQWRCTSCERQSCTGCSLTTKLPPVLVRVVRVVRVCITRCTSGGRSGEVMRH
jgi:hypothetical protein